jgi:S-adenosylmethionine-diacylgycerolhomoserine-N-methlytransferase
MKHVYVVDLTPSLLAIARQRCRDEGWTNVTVLEGDATHLPLRRGVADIVTCSYSLTMIPAWQGAVHEAARLLKPGGTFGAVDFYVGPDHPVVTQRLWPWWFAHSHVYLSQEHLPYLKHCFGATSLHEARTRLPYLPVGRVPYYRFTGTRR